MPLPDRCGAESVATTIQPRRRCHDSGVVIKAVGTGASHESRRQKKSTGNFDHYDWTLVKDDALRFENLIAMHLLKWVHYEQDVEGRDLELRYFRDVDGREVDFIITEDRKPILAVECKRSPSEISKSLRYFKTRFPTCNAWQIALEGTKDYVTLEGIRSAPALQLLQTLA